MALDPLNFGLGERLLIFALLSYISFTSLSCCTAWTVVSGCVVLYFTYVKYRYNYWKRQGIPSPPSSIIFGHTPALNRGLKTIDAEWREQYGPVFGTFMFEKPDLVVADLDILRHVFVKNFSHFVNRRFAAARLPGQNRGNSSSALLAKVLTVLEDQHWKDVRSTITPAFTTGKMKNLAFLFNDCLKIMGEIVSAHVDNEKPMDLKSVCGGFSMDVIAKSAFAIDVDAQHDELSPFIKFAKEIFGIKMTDPKAMLFLLFPQTFGLLERALNFNLLFTEADEFFTTMLTSVIKERKERPKMSKPDFLQLLLNTVVDSKLNKNDMADEEIANSNLGGKHLQLSLRETIAQCLIVLLAGFETSSLTLHFTLYLLSLHPEIQDKCFDEICDVLGDTTEISYEHVQKLHYIEQVINETLRMYSPSQRVNRECSKDITIKGIKIERGVTVSAPIYVIHYDEKNYPDPYKFDPDRFTPEEKAKRDPLAFLPFGYGPRNCIGMRFAQIELKMAVALLIKRFRFLPSDLSQGMPIRLSPQGSTKPEKPLFVNVQARQ
uniref:Uncharacterized protein n=1 Tax=Plectus sambesii TaxID=2011161 RepID=A0A914XGE2_9BILA